MNEWTNERRKKGKEWRNERMNERINEWMNEGKDWMIDWIDEGKNRKIVTKKRKIEEIMNKWTKQKNGIKERMSEKKKWMKERKKKDEIMNK